MVKLGIAGVVALLGCTPPRTPTAADLAAGVELGAVAVRIADDACASAANNLREAGNPQGAADLAGECVRHLAGASKALQASARAIDAGSAETAPCAILGAAVALRDVTPVLSRYGVKVPARVQRFTEFAAIFAGVCQ